MRWTLLLVLAGLVLPAPASAATGAPAQVRLSACATGEATFQGDMRAVRGALRLQMRFTLQMRENAGEPWARVVASRLDTWVSSAPGKLRYVYDKRVEGLVGPGEYRVRVRFRWLDAAGAVVARAQRVSRTCRQRDPRPNLQLQGFDYADGAFLVTVRNVGRTAAEPFDVSLQGALVERTTTLAPGARTTLRFEAPPCSPGSSVKIVIDAADDVDETPDSDHALDMICPVGGE
jgi:hypothetical protein